MADHVHYWRRPDRQWSQNIDRTQAIVKSSKNAAKKTANESTRYSKWHARRSPGRASSIRSDFVGLGL